jgi:adenylate kinase family enzyme
LGGFKISNNSVIDGNIKIIVQRVVVEGYGAILLTGPSSCGKGEIANELRRFLSIPKERHLSMGDILRRTVRKAREDDSFRERLASAYNISDKISVFEETENRVENISKAKKHEEELRLFYNGRVTISQLDWLEFCVIEGLLVPDEWTVNIINATFEDSEEFQKEIFILDGYPRTIKAAEELLNTFVKFNIPIIKVVHLSISKDEMIKRALGRKRFDDKKESLERRYQFYVENVQPSIDYLKVRLGSSKVTLIDAHQPVYNEQDNIDIKKSIKQVTLNVLESLGLPKYLLEMNN